MISHLRGVVEQKGLNFAVLDVQGVGYRVFMTSGLLAELAIGEEAKIPTYLAVREDAMDLYGFRNQDELRFFELLISISGIGPKSALSILNITTLDSLRQAVASEDTTHLTRVSGIGRKTAERIVIELRGKLDGFEFEAIATDTGSIKEEVDALEALKSLGYSQKESQEALKLVPKDIIGTGEKVKHALRLLASNQ
ncbi:MAG TPA: Holliday junction branch migration protein RuvA [Candidatus Paceibacterota bacterium]|jgi:Holliday junction DNA helicase RuvA|nr:Holliday junction branch migration protein RuvA [Candidatus Paceibacterota bacterium]